MPARGDLLRHLHHMGEVGGIDVEQVARRRLRQHQRVPGRARHDVEEGERLVVLVDLVAGQFAAQDFREDVVLGVVGSASSVLLAGTFRPARTPDPCGTAPIAASSVAGRRHIGALALEIVRNRASQRRVGDVVRRIGRSPACSRAPACARPGRRPRRHQPRQELVVSLNCRARAFGIVRHRNHTRKKNSTRASP